MPAHYRHNNGVHSVLRSSCSVLVTSLAVWQLHSRKTGRGDQAQVEKFLEPSGAAPTTWQPGRWKGRLACAIRDRGAGRKQLSPAAGQRTSHQRGVRCRELQPAPPAACRVHRSLRVAPQQSGVTSASPQL
ncbi:hypothetical protein NDU88_005836 [Pleurodeles waltl]|uniref:Secreted protein n=1 Tax=Pleurodeles waltl TaxID=8319 RepID=A0AAV7TVZ6_PLEWA|nr:hypothetical protein NDU88_005836 [Pleurodeles waltl]